jgi:hypothetical protein
MRLNRSIALAALTVTVSACTRPAEVREVAAASQPLVAGLQKSGPALAERFRAQREAFGARAASEAKLAAAARARADAIERTWRLVGTEAPMKKLAVLREADEQIRADPIAPAAAAANAAKAEGVDLSALNKTLAGLDQLKGANRMTWQEVASFAQEVNAELAKLEEEASAGTALGAEASEEELAPGSSQEPATQPQP